LREDNGAANDQDGDKTGLWGLVGLLLGVAGLTRRDEPTTSASRRTPRRLAT
jgi:hypothetical protein